MMFFRGMTGYEKGMAQYDLFGQIVSYFSYICWVRVNFNVKVARSSHYDSGLLIVRVGINW